MSINEYGTVYLVGAGPGNPSLLTKRAQRLIENADIILYDRLVNPFILQYAKPEIEIVDVGKKPYTKHIQQESINQKRLKLQVNIIMWLDLKVAIRYIWTSPRRS